MMPAITYEGQVDVEKIRRDCEHEVIVGVLRRPCMAINIANIEKDLLGFNGKHVRVTIEWGMPIHKTIHKKRVIKKVDSEFDLSGLSGHDKEFATALVNDYNHSKQWRKEKLEELDRRLK